MSPISVARIARRFSARVIACHPTHAAVVDEPSRCSSGGPAVRQTARIWRLRHNRCSYLDSGEIRMSAELSRQAIGWVSSALLVLTLGRQVHKQWREGSTEGISSWLFVGQTAASTGFTIYSVLVRDWVFVVTNALMLLNGLLGYFILMRNRRASGAARPEPAANAPGTPPPVQDGCAR